jgi:hypothetical protein
MSSASSLNPNSVASIRRQIERITLTPNDQGTLDVHLYARRGSDFAVLRGRRAHKTTPRPWWTGA